MGGSMSEFFHAFVRTHSHPGWMLVDADLTAGQLKSRVVRPYHAGSRVVRRGVVTDMADVCEVRILKTSMPCSQAVSQLDREHTEMIEKLNSGDSTVKFVDTRPRSDPLNLVDGSRHVVSNVTDESIHGPPGQESAIVRLWKVITSNPLASTVIGGLLVLVVWRLIHG